MQALADGGAKVVHAEAVEWARRNQIEIICSATDGGRAQGTRIVAESEGLSHPKVVAVTRYDSMFVIEPSTPGYPPPPNLEETLVAHGASAAGFGHTGRLARLRVIKERTASMLFVQRFKSYLEHHCAKILTIVTAVGPSLATPPAVVTRVAQVLREAAIDVYGRWVEPSRLAFLVPVNLADRAVSLLHHAFIDGTETS